MIHKVKTLCHRFKPATLGVVFSRTITKTVRFDPSCIYDFSTDDQLDINKLFGVGYLHHHWCSARFGWRWNAQAQAIEIWAYCYDKGLRRSAYIGNIVPDKEYIFRLQVHPKSYDFRIYSFDGGMKYTRIPVSSHFQWIGYKLGPYFGGNLPAPHNMQIEIK